MSRTSRKVILPDGVKAIEVTITIGKGSGVVRVFEYKTRWTKSSITRRYPADLTGRIYDLRADGSRVEQLEHELRESTLCLNDWTHTYAPEFCDEETVAIVDKRIKNNCGTLAYIADRVAANRFLLEKK